MERNVGRLLTSDEIVHHVNHEKTDNRIENLQIVTRAEHARLHINDTGLLVGKTPRNQLAKEGKLLCE